jgi:hypothetical protein
MVTMMGMTTAAASAAIAVPKRARNAIMRAGHAMGDLTSDQRDRAATCDRLKAGLTGRALANWILTGDSRTDPPPEERAADPVAPPIPPPVNKRTRTTMPKPSTPPTATTAVRRPSALKHAEDALRTAGRPMHMRALADAVIAAAAGTLKGKTPAATVSARVSVCARDGGPIEKIAPGVFALREWDAATKATPPLVPDGVKLRQPKHTEQTEQTESAA